MFAWFASHTRRQVCGGETEVEAGGLQGYAGASIVHCSPRALRVHLRTDELTCENRVMQWRQIQHRDSQSAMPDVTREGHAARALTCPRAPHASLRTSTIILYTCCIHPASSAIRTLALECCAILLYTQKNTELANKNVECKYFVPAAPNCNTL